MHKVFKNTFLTYFKPKKKAEDEISFADSFDGNEGFLSALTPDYIKEDVSTVQLGANFTRTLILMDYQTILSRESIQAIQEINKNVSLSMHFERANMSEIRSGMSKAIKQSRNRQVDNNLDDASKVEADLQGKSAVRVIKEMAAGNEVMYHAFIFIHIVGKTQDELERLTQHVKSFTGAIGTAYNPNKKARAAYKAFLPLLDKDEVRSLSERLINSEAVSYFFPFHENEMFDEDGSFVGVNDKTKNVILVNIDKLLNKHKFYIGMSGLGKSTALFKDLINEWREGAKVYALDPKGEFGPRFKDLGGEHIKFDLSGKNRINFFDLPKHGLIDAEESMSGNPVHNKIPTLLVAFQLIYKSLTAVQYNILADVIEKTYAAKQITENSDFSKLNYMNMPIFSDFDEQLNELKKESVDRYEHLKDFHISISAFVSGMYAKLFNGHTNVDVDNDLVAYNTMPISQNEYLQKILYYVIMDNLTNIGINNTEGVPLRFAFDEVHVIADPSMPLAMKQLFYMMKVLRSFNVGISPATQSISDLLSAKDEKRNYGEAVITQSVQKLFLPLDISEIRLLEKEVGYTFSKKEITILRVRDGDKDKQAGKGILFIGSKKIQCNVVLNNVEKQIWFDKKHPSEIAI